MYTRRKIRYNIRMKILLTGGGTGGHFYPLIAIAEELNKLADEERLLSMKLYYMADKPYDEKALQQQFITFIPITAGKLRVYFSIQNFIDIFKTFFGTIGAIIKMFRLYPDVVISKGGYPAFPVLVAARLFRIPVIIHESDTVPGRVNVWAGKFARRIALSYPEAAQFFDEKKIAVTGQPIRKTISYIAPADNAKEFFDLDPNIATIGIVGGSLGAKVLNDAITSILPQLTERYQVIHQTGEKTFEETKTDAAVIMGDDVRRTRYKIFAFLNEVQTKMFGSASDIIISRAGSGLFEIAAWGKPSIIIPIPESNSHGDHQRKNAYHYARTGACVVIEQTNVTGSVLLNEIRLILENKIRYDVMAGHAKQFYRPDAARIIATEAIDIALEHTQ